MCVFEGERERERERERGQREREGREDAREAERRQLNASLDLPVSEGWSRGNRGGRETHTRKHIHLELGERDTHEETHPSGAGRERHKETHPSGAGRERHKETYPSGEPFIGYESLLWTLDIRASVKLQISARFVILCSCL